jgi:hypothetical protein
VTHRLVDRVPVKLRLAIAASLGSLVFLVQRLMLPEARESIFGPSTRGPSALSPAANFVARYASIMYAINHNVFVIFGAFFRGASSPYIGGRSQWHGSMQSWVFLPALGFGLSLFLKH